MAKEMLFSPYGEDDKILPDISMLNKLSFNGFHGEYYDHEERFTREFHFPTTESIEARGFTDGFPNVYDFVDGLYDVYGDCVGIVKDNAGNVLYDNVAEMTKIIIQYGHED